MKYERIDLNSKLFGENYLIYDWKEDAEHICISVKSQTHTSICPFCGHSSTVYHATYLRKIQLMPIHMKNTVAEVIAYKYNCLNTACNYKVFMEPLPFVSPSQVRTDELTCVILAVSLFLSNEGASKVLALLGIKVSNDTIKRIYDRLIIEDDPDVTQVGIDDVAIRRGKTYATAVYDLKDHHLIALLDGRDSETLRKWLSSHDKIRLVARDRASAYAKAINEALPECVQVADRFHLLQNLIEKMRDIFKTELPAEIFIKDGEVLDENPDKVKKIKISPNDKVLEAYTYDNTPPTDETGNEIIYDNKNRNQHRQQYQKQAQGRKKNRN